MDNKDEQEYMNNESDNENGPANEEIPPWLQGFNESELDNTKPIEVEDNLSDEWVRETGETAHEPSDQLDFETSQGLEIEESDQPEHDLSVDEHSLDGHDFVIDENADPPAERAVDDGFEISDLVTDETSQTSPPADDAAPSSEGFLDISEINLSDTLEQEETAFDDEPLRQGDLPEWLQEMITESEEEQPGESAPSAYEEHEIDEHPPEIVAEPSGLEVKLSLENLADVDHPKDLAVPELSLDDDGGNLKAEEETSPLQRLMDDVDIPTFPEGLPVIEDFDSDKTDSQLDLVKQHLYHGDFSEALPIIREMVDESTHLEELESWILQADTLDEIKNSQMLEILGDIAFRQNKPQDAFDAYAKAIKYLLKYDEASDETG